MSSMRYGMVLAVKEHIAAGNPITTLESIVLFGVPSLTKVISDMRKEGWVIQSRLTPYATAVARVNRHATLQPPSNLPVREVQLTEYWIIK
jgi:hypothetical protein